MATTTTITDLDEDALAHCADYLSLRDVSNLSITCKSLKRLAYSDSIWHRFFREHWPLEANATAYSQAGGVGGMRGAYLGRYVAVQKLKFVDPFVLEYYVDAKPFDHIILDKNHVIFSQGSVIQMLKINKFVKEIWCDSTTLSDHNARITCMRLFPFNETSLFRSGPQRGDNVLVTSSCDHSIRLWWKGSCQRCFRGHNGPVLTLSDKLLGDGSTKVLASGGEDGTVRLWSLSSSGKRGQHALKATLYGHEKPIKLMSVAGHKTSLLATVSRDSKVRVWDTTASSAVRSSCCVGMASVPGAPVDIKCHESLLYIASGSSVVAVDLRTMQKVISATIGQPKLYSFAILPSKSLICVGGDSKALLWDVRMNQETLKSEPVAEFDGLTGPVTFMHMDPYKVVTGGPEDCCINVLETDTGMKANCLNKDLSHYANMTSVRSAMAVKGTQIVTASYDDQHGVVQFTDFFHATCPALEKVEEHASKFWDPQSFSDDDR